MSDKFKVPLHLQVTVEERLSDPEDKRWHVQFPIYPLGYFRGQGKCPGTALAAAWKNFRKEVHPGKRWWSVVLGPPPSIRW